MAKQLTAFLAMPGLVPLGNSPLMSFPALLSSEGETCIPVGEIWPV